MVPTIWVGSEQPAPPQPSKPWESASAIVMTIAAVFSVITQSADHPIFAWTLVVIAGLVFLTAFSGRAIRWGRETIGQAQRNRIARKQWPEFLRLGNRFGKFVSRDDSSNLRQVLRSACGSNDTELSKLCPPDYLKDLYELFLARCEAAAARDEHGFSFAVDELNLMVSFYNKDYVLEPLRRLKSENRLDQLPTGHRQHYADQIEDFRERWVRFLDDFKEFLDKANNDLGYDPYHEAFGTYFERPGKL